MAKVPMVNRLRLWLLCLFALAVGCQSAVQVENAILIGIKTESIAMLKNPQLPDPKDTGIASLDALNVKWNVKAMTPVFDVSLTDEAAVKAGLAGVYKLVVPTNTNLANMIEDYQADSHVEYAELNAPVQTQ